MPFGTVYVDIDDPILEQHPERIEPGPGRLLVGAKLGTKPELTYKPCNRSSIGFVQMNLKGLTFDEVPLRYLDWLAGQEWTYGQFMERLHAYLKHPAIQRELDELFPDPEDDSRKPMFWGRPDYNTESTVTCKIRSGAQRRESMPKPEPDNHIPASYVLTKTQAWERAAEYLALFDSITESDTPHERWQEEVNHMELRAICKVISPVAATKLRQAYRTCRQKVLDSYPKDAQYWQAYDALSELMDRQAADRAFNKRVNRLTNKVKRWAPTMRRAAKKCILKRSPQHVDEQRMAAQAYIELQAMKVHRP